MIYNFQIVLKKVTILLIMIYYKNVYTFYFLHNTLFIGIDLWRVIMMASGIALIYASRSLCANPVFFYLCGIIIGVSASFMVLVYYVSKFLPRVSFSFLLLYFCKIILGVKELF